MRLIVPCPAKINLFLAVGPRDERGYHPLRTEFQALGLFDYLEIEPASEDAFACASPEVPEENTVTRAWRLVREIAELPPMKVRLVKGIPAQSGLGGGSSDAAGFLRATNLVAPHPPSEAELRQVARTVGADVPFFLVGGRARAEGYGERLQPLPDPEPAWYVVARPRVSCSTPEMFARLDEQDYAWRDFADELYNDFERVAPCESLDLIERLQALGAEGAGLSGSGSATFGRFPTHAHAERVAAKLNQERIDAWACRALSRRQSLAIERLD
jgi:4-diphosphocytidyl-2-C-methyl-D-erythritol kinase